MVTYTNCVFPFRLISWHLCAAMLKPRNLAVRLPVSTNNWGDLECYNWSCLSNPNPNLLHALCLRYTRGSFIPTRQREHGKQEAPKPWLQPSLLWVNSATTHKQRVTLFLSAAFKWQHVGEGMWMEAWLQCPCGSSVRPCWYESTWVMSTN